MFYIIKYVPLKVYDYSISVFISSYIFNNALHVRIIIIKLFYMLKLDIAGILRLRKSFSNGIKKIRKLKKIKYLT